MKWFILLMIFSSLVQAKAYKCKTAAGKTTYQQSPCKPDESVNDYKHREESEGTKSELTRVRKEKEDKEAAIIETRKKYESSDSYRNLQAAKLNAQTQNRREISDSMNNLQRIIDNERENVRSLYRAAGRR